MFMPVFCWLISSSLLFLWQFHRTQARGAGITLELSPPHNADQSRFDFGPEITLNGKLYQPGEPSGVGRKRLVIRAKGSEEFQTNLFIWYAGKDLGTITLPRSQGQLELRLSPAAKSVQIVGLEKTQHLEVVTEKTLSLPTGQYAVRVNYTHFTLDEAVDIARNQTSLVSSSPKLTALRLRSVPENADFELTSKQSPKVLVKGNVPTTLPEMPIGEYDLTLTRNDYRKTVSVSLDGNKTTNELQVEFEYSRLSVTSDPEGATVKAHGTVLGTTPNHFDLQPGAYELQIAKDGYFGTNVLLQLSAKSSPVISVTLQNVSLSEALERAERHLTSGFPDYDRALADVEKALLIKPEDETAKLLKHRLTFNRHLQNAGRFQQKQDFARAVIEAEAALRMNPESQEGLALKREVLAQKDALDKTRADVAAKEAALRADARKARPKKLLEEICRYVPHQEFFDDRLMRFSGSVNAVHEAVRRALAAEPQWTIQRDEKQDDDVRVVIARMNGALRKDKVVMVIGQTRDDDVEVCYKIIALRGFFDTAAAPAKPYHAKNEQGVQAEFINKQLAQDVAEFRKRVDAEFYKK